MVDSRQQDTPGILTVIMPIHTRHILNPVFLTSLSMLLINDHFLKEHYPNWLTGKLSDVFGILVFVQFLSVFTKEKSKIFLYLVSALAFVIWKSEWSSAFIDFWNLTFPYLKIQRVVDYSDLICLPGLIPLYAYKPRQFEFSLPKEIITYPIFVITLFAITATTRFKGFTLNEIYVDDTVKLKMNRTEFLDQLTKDQIVYSKDSFYIFAKDTFDRYVLNTIIISPDTIHKATIGIHDKKKRIEVYIDSITLSKDRNSSMFLYHSDYKRWIKKYKVATKGYFNKLDE